MKSHDCNIFLKYLLPIAYSYLPTHILNPHFEVSQFYKKKKKVFFNIKRGWSNQNGK